MPDALIPYLALIPYAAVAVGLVCTLLFFVSLKWELHRTTRRERKRVDQLLARLEESTVRVAASALPPEAIFVPVAPRAGLNVNRRVHVLRLLRKGEDPAHIAAALGVPRAEVDLLIRVQEMIAEKAAANAPPKRDQQALPAVAGE